jgi:hypothetical protein
MLTKDEVEKLWKWVDYNYRKSQNGNTIESISDYIERGLIECELYEREPTAKEKWEAEKKSWDVWLKKAESGDRAVGVSAIIALFDTADAAIQETKNARR